MYLCYVSSEDDVGPALALRTVRRTSRGWQSAKYCTYPQELGFRFEGLVKVSMVRLLAHECKISSSIEVSVATPTSEELQRGTCSTYEEAKFRRLGHARFHTNAEKDFRSRELKSIGIGQECTYLKLHFRRPHKDDANPFGQVGVVALMAHGVQLHAMSYPPTGNIDAFIVSESIETRLEEMAPLTEEESDVVNYDAVQVVANRIAILTREKKRAVTDADYDRAAKLKAQINALEGAQEQLARLEEEKRRAVKVEDYEQAKQLKLRIEALLNVDSLWGVAPTTVSSAVSKQQQHQQQQPQQQGGQSGTASSTRLQQQKDGMRAAPETGPVRSIVVNRSGSHDDAVVSGKGFYDVDSVTDPFGPSGNASSGSPILAPGEREVPLSGNGAPWELQLNTAIASFIADKSVPASLVGDAVPESKAFEKELGVYCTACLFARRGQLREAAIRGIVSDAGYSALSSHTTVAIEALMAYLSTEGRGVGDPISGVVFASCDALVKLLAGKLSSDHVPSAIELSSHVAALSPELVSRIGDANARVREGVEGVIFAVCRSPIGPDRLVSLLLVDPDAAAKKAVSYRTHLARLNLLSAFVDMFGVRGGSTPASAHALDTRHLLDQAILPCMQNASSEVREAAAALFAKLLLRDAVAAKPALARLKSAQQAVVEEQLALMTAAEEGKALPPNTQSSQPSKAAVRGGGAQARVGAQDTRGSELYDASGDGTDEGPSKTPLPPLELSGASSRELRTLLTCQFCGEYNKHFTEINLDIHYVRSCPMLCPCPLCDQVTEICTLQRHLVSECEGMHLVRECPRCHEAIRAQEFKQHWSLQSCIEAVAAYSVCPLCHDRFRAGMDGWRQHLATAPGCPNNPRKYDGSGPVML